jgi:hypothetical protein
MSDAKEGELFRTNYLRSPVKLADSKRARRRLSKLFEDSMANGVDFANAVRRQLGIDYPITTYGYDHEGFWVHSEVGDFLSGITLWSRIVRHHKPALDAARRILDEEDLHYRIDDKGGVHYFVDELFAYTVESTLAGLGDARFTAARHALEGGLKSLGPTHQSGKGLIRGVFEAVETTFLVIVGPDAGDRLNKQAVERYLKPILITHFATVPDAEDKVSRLLDGFNAWVKEAHPFRHGTATGEEVHEAPLDLAVLSANTGMGFIRFLSGI